MTDGWAMAESEPAAATAPPGVAGAARAAVTIGPARFRDLRAVARLQKRSFRPRLAYGLGTLALLWALPHVRFLVARAPLSPPSPAVPVVGCVIGDKARREVRVINLAVDPAARRRGVGRALLAALEAAFPEGDLILMVEEENTAAHALYLQAGYREVGFAQNYYGRGRGGRWMQKRRGDGKTARWQDGGEGGRTVRV